MMSWLINLGGFLLLLGLGFYCGKHAERKHYESILRREARLRQLVVLSYRVPPPQFAQHHALLVYGNVVISIDFFKRVYAYWHALIGGRLRAYESLLDRARREAILRMQAQAHEQGAQAIINIKFETSTISGNLAEGIGSVEILAYGSALIPPAAEISTD